MFADRICCRLGRTRRNPNWHLYLTADTVGFGQFEREPFGTRHHEGLHEDFTRQIKPQTVLPSAETAARLFWAAWVTRMSWPNGTVRVTYFNPAWIRAIFAGEIMQPRPADLSFDKIAFRKRKLV
ncbi:MAG: hypothetical protein ACREC9_09720 [Methylocella sp.]